MIALSYEEKDFLYSWLKNLLSHELTEEQLIQYQLGEFSPLFEFLSAQGMAEEMRLIRNELMKLYKIPFSHLELAADFSQLFLLDLTASALPYASAYLEGNALTKHLAFLDKLLSALQLAINKTTKEPSDHLAVYLEILIHLEKNGDNAQVVHFINAYFLPWLKPFYHKACSIHTQTRFYQHVIMLLLTLLTNRISETISSQ
ncbi:MAG: molecular chaperone TorD [[Pasteurella] mairii]|uniref:Chaperone protein torD n=1 Tax=[Pasteurella] mairii TaxID=757 RepID=A0A379B1Z0_9PAST|nr:molecular chaperone TorD [[Pasteurella] mairii]SUB32521.1 chaperone protein torD [[Pasteurella] mairii]